MSVQILASGINGDAGFTNGTTPVLLVPTPRPGFLYNVNFIHVRNILPSARDATLRIVRTTPPGSFDVMLATMSAMGGATPFWRPFSSPNDGIVLHDSGRGEQLWLILNNAGALPWVATWEEHKIR